jgi:hypothetical protein
VERDHRARQVGVDGLTRDVEDVRNFLQRVTGIHELDDGALTHVERCKHIKMAKLAGLTNRENNMETLGSVESEEAGLSDCFNGSPGCSTEVWVTR